MKVDYAEQNSFKKIIKENFDFIFCSSGFEKRATFFYSEFSKLNSKGTTKICFSFGDRKVLSRKENDTFFRTNHFKFVEIEKSDLIALIDTYDQIFSEVKNESLKILFDYSCMTKVMYAGLIKYFELNEDSFKNVSIYFSYTQAIYSEPTSTKSNLHNEPIPLFPTVGHTDKKIALIVGLGYEEGKAQGLIDFMEIENTDIYLFFTSKLNEESFHQKVIDNNDYLLKKIPTQNHFEYELKNITHLMNLLESLCNYLLSKDYRVIIAPLGPKLFSLACILLTLKHHELTVLRVSDGEKGDPTERLPNTDKEFLIVHLKFLNTVENLPVNQELLETIS